MSHCLRNGNDDAEVENRIHSLRDADNYPHVTFAFLEATEDDPRGWIGAIAGNGNTRPIKRAYAARILGWLNSLPYPVVLCREGLEGPPRNATVEWNDELSELEMMLEPRATKRAMTQTAA